MTLLIVLSIYLLPILICAGLVYKIDLSKGDTISDLIDAMPPFWGVPIINYITLLIYSWELIRAEFEDIVIK